MRWSYSSLSSFKQCKYQFYLNYIVRDDEQYLREGNYYAELGSFMHEILAKIYKGELKPEDASLYFSENYENNVFYREKESIMENAYNACLYYFLDEDFQWLDGYEVVGVEKPVQFIIEPYRFIGYIDLLLRDKKDGVYVILDNKSGHYPLQKNGKVKTRFVDTFEDYKKQMYLYSHAVYLETSQFPKLLQWNFFKDGGKIASIPFDKSDYDKTLHWLIDSIHTIEAEEEFPPTPTYFYCNRLCNFRNSCEYAGDYAEQR